MSREYGECGLGHVMPLAAGSVVPVDTDLDSAFSLPFIHYAAKFLPNNDAGDPHTPVVLLEPSPVTFRNVGTLLLRTSVITYFHRSDA